MNAKVFAFPFPVAKLPAMKASVLGVVVLLLSGCDSLSDATLNVREKFAAREEGRTKNFPVPSRVAYEAVRVAANQMGYRFLRGGAAQGELEAVNGVSSGDSLRSARQISMKVRLHAADEKSTDVTLRLTEVLEGDSSGRAGQATESPLRDTPQYEVFFREVQKALDARAGGSTK
jgi:hypothetical protein